MNGRIGILSSWGEREKKGVINCGRWKGGKILSPENDLPGINEIRCFQALDLHNEDTIGRGNLLFGGIRMLDYKEIIKHYGGGMSGRALVEQGGGSKSVINNFLSAFETAKGSRSRFRRESPIKGSLNSFTEQTIRGALYVGTLPLSA